LVLILVAFHHALFYAHPAGYIQNTDHQWLNYPHSGSSNGEYDPIWFANHQNMRLEDKLVGRLKGQPLFAQDDQTGRAQIETTVQSWTGSAMTYQVVTPVDIDLLQATLYFPGWQVIVDGVNTPINYQDSEFSGRLIFPLTVGRHDVQVTFTNDTWDRRIGDKLTLIGLGLVALQIGHLGWKKLRQI
jgi:hypothetical protein